MATEEFSDDFNRSDSTNLGANWTEETGNFAIASNALDVTGVDGSNKAVVLHNTSPSSKDCYVQATFVDSSTYYPRLFARANGNVYASPNDGYALEIRMPNSDYYIIAYENGSLGWYEYKTGLSFSANDVWRLEVENVGSDIELRTYKNDSLVETHTDDTTKIDVIGQVGVGSGTPTGMTFDDFSGGILGAAPTSTIRGSLTMLGVG